MIYYAFSGAGVVSHLSAQQLQRRNEVNHACFDLSLSLVRRCGLKTTLVCDEAGRAILGDLPFDHIRLVSVSGIDPRFWAAIKFEAYKMMRAGDIYLDGDVFFFDPDLLLRVVEAASNVDLTVYAQEIFDGNVDGSFHRNAFHSLKGYSRVYLRYPISLAPCDFNCGVVAFGDDILREEYILRYTSNARACSALMRHQRLQLPAHVIPDLLLEQACLYDLAIDRKVAIVSKSNSNRINPYALPNVCHLAGVSKDQNLELIQSIAVRYRTS